MMMWPSYCCDIFLWCSFRRASIHHEYSNTNKAGTVLQMISIYGDAPSLLSWFTNKAFCGDNTRCRCQMQFWKPQKTRLQKTMRLHSFSFTYNVDISYWFFPNDPQLEMSFFHIVRNNYTHLSIQPATRTVSVDRVFTHTPNSWTVRD